MKNKSNREWRKKVGYLYMAIIFLLPLIVFYKKIIISEELKMYFGNVHAIGDFFAYYKAKLLQFGAPIALALTLYFKKREGWKFKFDKFTILLVAFSGSIIISTLFSPHKSVAFFGYPERFEGAWTWLSYLMLSYGVYLYTEGEEDVQKLMKAFVYSTGVVSLIGVLQFLGFDLFNSTIGKMLILGSEYGELGDQLVFRFPPKTVYSTLYNPNYVGSMVALAIPAIAFLFSKTNVMKYRVVYGLIALLNMVALIGSKSTGGFIATAVSIVLLVGYFIATSPRKKQLTIIMAGLVLLSSILIFGTSLFDSQLTKLKNLSTLTEETPKQILDMNIKDSTLKVTGVGGESIIVQHDNASIWVTDEDGNIIADEMDENGYLLAARQPYENWVIQYYWEEDKLQVAYRRNIESVFGYFNIYNVVDGFTLFGPKIDNDELHPSVARILSNEKAFSNRGYIWNRSIPLIFERPLIGYGADTFALKFPQHDLIGRSKVLLTTKIIVDKVHNFHLQVMFNFGFLGLMIFFLVFMLCVFKGYYLISVGLIAFMISGAVNDSTVFTTSVVFIFLGLHSPNKRSTND